MADYGELRKTNAGPEFTLYHGTQQEEDKNTGHVSMVFFDSYKFNLSFLSGTKDFEKFYDANELYIGQLMKKDANGEYDDKYFVHANQRLVWPLYSFALPLFIVSIMLSMSYARRELVYKNVVVVGVTSIFVISALGFHNAALKNVNLVWLLHLNLMLVLIGGFVKLFKPKFLSYSFFSKIPKK